MILPVFVPQRFTEFPSPRLYASELYSEAAHNHRFRSFPTTNLSMGVEEIYLSPAEAAQMRVASGVSKSVTRAGQDNDGGHGHDEPFFLTEFMALFSDCLGVGGGALTHGSTIDNVVDDDRDYEDSSRYRGLPFDDDDFVDLAFREDLEHPKNLNMSDSWSCDSSINTTSGIFTVDSTRKVHFVVDPRLKGSSSSSRPSGLGMGNTLHLICEDDDDYASVATLASSGSTYASPGGRLPTSRLPDYLSGGGKPTSWNAIMAPSKAGAAPTGATGTESYDHLLPPPYRRATLSGDLDSYPNLSNKKKQSSTNKNIDNAADFLRDDRSYKTEGGKVNVWNSKYHNSPRILGTSIHDETTKPHVLTTSIMEALQQHLPYSKQGEGFWLKYSMVRDGASLYTVLETTKRSSYTVLAVETLDGEVFGAFTAQPWHITWTYYGTPESFLWRLKKRRKGNPKRDVLSQQDKNGDDEDTGIEIFRFAGNNQNIQLCNIDRLAVGGGSPDDDSIVSDDLSHVRMTEWGFGLAFNKHLQQGTSSPCTTFNSPSLSKKHSDGSRFEVSNLEFWTLTPCISVEEAKRMERSKSMMVGNSSATLASW